MDLDEEEYLPLSGLQHLVYCPRQCALIHIEGTFVESHLTLEGSLAHAPVNQPGRRLREEVPVETDVWLRSERLGVVGKADRVERHGIDGVVEWVPVESKRARRHAFEADCVQLCAQGIALEEMRSGIVRRGILYYIKQRRRVEVAFDPALRARTLEAARAYHEIIREGRVPPARFDARCPDCSLRSACLPRVTENGGRVAEYMRRLVET